MKIEVDVKSSEKCVLKKMFLQSPDTGGTVVMSAMQIAIVSAQVVDTAITLNTCMKIRQNECTFCLQRKSCLTVILVVLVTIFAHHRDLALTKSTVHVSMRCVTVVVSVGSIVVTSVIARVEIVFGTCVNIDQNQSRRQVQ